MVDNYTNMVNNKTPQNKPIVGQKDMKENLAGGFAFEANGFTILDRWLLTGSTNNGFYQGSREMTTDNLTFLELAIKEDVSRVGERIVYASNNGMNNSTPLLALVVLSTHIEKNKEASVVFHSTFKEIVRTATHLFEFSEYVKAFRGYGRSIRTAVRDWFDNHSDADVDAFVEVSDEMPISHLKELVVCVKCFGMSMADAVTKVKGMMNTEEESDEEDIEDTTLEEAECSPSSSNPSRGPLDGMPLTTGAAPKG